MRRKNGFTLVELLAVVVILGIILMISVPAVNRWIDRGKVESDEGNKKALIMAAQSYAQGNSEILPKAIGDSSTVTAESLKNENFLKTELVNSENKNCMQSYVKILKKTKNTYKYVAYMKCEGDPAIADVTETKPIISISFSGEKNENGQVDDVKVSAFKAVIEGGNTSSKKYTLASYSYSISVRYSSSDKIVEIYNSGNIEASQQERVVVEKNLSDYTDITTVNDFIVTVEAYNSIGGYLKKTANSSYKDSDAPKCGKITGQAGEGEWIRTPHTRTISVACSDGDGSGCVKDVFTKTFDTEMEYGYITISDNAGNTKDCQVRVLHDWTKPTLTVTAYVRYANGSRGSVQGSATADENNPTVTLKDYKNSYNGWLNRANFPGGVTYVVSTRDNVLLRRGRFHFNTSGIYDVTSAILEKFEPTAFRSFSASDNSTEFNFTTAGLRRGKYTLSDAAGNEVTVKVRANIDLTDPTIKAAKTGGIGSTSGVTVSVYCTDTQSGCPQSSTDYTGQKATTTYTVTDNAGNSSSTSVTITSEQCHCSDCYTGHNTCKGGTVCGSWGAWSGCTYNPGTSSNSTRQCTECGSQMTDQCRFRSCNWSDCATGENTCAWGCDTCYR